MNTARARLLVGGVLVVMVAGGLSYRFWSGSRAPPAATTATDSRVAPPQTIEVDREVAPSPAVPDNKLFAVAIQEIRVTFPSGRIVPVEMKEVPESPPLPDTFYPRPLIEQYAQLRNLAEAGDPVAARTLFRELKRCRRAYSSKESLREATEKLRRDRLIVLPASSGRPPLRVPDGEDLSLAEDNWLKKPFEQCAGITEEQKAEAIRWIEISAAANDYQGLQEYALELGYTPAGVEAWERIWDMGYKAALAPLARLYTLGVPPITGGQADYVHAYAYRFIGYKLMEAAYQGSTTANHLRHLSGLRDGLNHTAGFMSPAQIEEATTLAENLLAANPNCCASAW
jgi:hypothetical protein